MTDVATYVSRYDQRVNLIKDTLQKHSKLNGKASHDLAERILDAIDHIPETVR